MFYYKINKRTSELVLNLTQQKMLTQTTSCTLPLVVKTQFNKEHRKFELSNITYEALVQTICKMYNLFGTILLSYKDHEKDIILLGSDMELQAAILDQNVTSTLPYRLLKLHVSQEEEKISDRKVQRKLQKERKHAAKKEIKKDSIWISGKEPWPASLQIVHLDGNNMMFLTGALRKLYLTKRVAECERLLLQTAQRFHNVSGAKQTVLWFDKTDLASSSTVLVKSAMPEYASADDALCQVPKDEHAIFVTADVGLRERLQKLGANLLKPKAWLNFAHEACDVEKKYEKPSQWMKFEVQQYKQ